MSRQDSFALVKKNKSKILKSQTKELDRCLDSYNNYSFSGYRFEYQHNQNLPKETANKAIKYIIAIVAAYPFQARRSMALPLWERFCQAWCETQDETKSLGAI